MQTTEFAVLPNVSPAATLAVVLAMLTPCLIAVWRKPSAGGLVRAAAYASMCRHAVAFYTLLLLRQQKYFQNASGR